MLAFILLYNMKIKLTPKTYIPYRTSHLVCLPIGRFLFLSCGSDDNNNDSEGENYEYLTSQHLRLEQNGLNKITASNTKNNYTFFITEIKTGIKHCLLPFAQTVLFNRYFYLYATETCHHNIPSIYRSKDLIQGEFETTVFTNAICSK